MLSEVRQGSAGSEKPIGVNITDGEQALLDASPVIDTALLNDKNYVEIAWFKVIEYSFIWNV